MTHHLEKAKDGDELEIKGPLGKFTLPEEINSDLFICTGTGLAPFRSILQSIPIHNITHKNIYLIFGTRTKMIFCVKVKWISLRIQLIILNIFQFFLEKSGRVNLDMSMINI